MDTKLNDATPNGGLKSDSLNNGQTVTNGEPSAEAKNVQKVGRKSIPKSDEVYDNEPTRKRLCDNEAINNPEKLDGLIITQDIGRTSPSYSPQMLNKTLSAFDE